MVRFRLTDALRGVTWTSDELDAQGIGPVVFFDGIVEMRLRWEIDFSEATPEERRRWEVPDLIGRAHLALLEGRAVWLRSQCWVDDARDPERCLRMHAEFKVALIITLALPQCQLAGFTDDPPGDLVVKLDERSSESGEPTDIEPTSE